VQKVEIYFSILVLAGLFIVSSVTGCGGNLSGGSEETDSGQESVTVDEGSDEIVDIIWQYPALSEQGEAFYRMEDALNEMMEKDIGVHVTFGPTKLLESQSDAILMVSAGEQLDICLTAFESVGNLVEQGLILPLDDLVAKSGGNITEQLGEHAERGKYKGTLYGIVPGDVDYQIYSYTMKTRFVEKYNIEVDDDKIYTLEEMEEIFDTVKAGEGDDFICFIPWNNTYDPLNYSLCEYDKLAGGLAQGVLMLNRSFEDTTIYNLFETEEYAQHAERMYRWAQKGFIAADASVSTDDPTEVFNRENVLGTFGYGEPEAKMMLTESYNDDVVQFKVVDIYQPGNGGGAILWNIPITSANPEKAMEALNYIYANKEAAWLIQYGFEGEEWEVVEDDGENLLIQYLEEDATQRAYANPYGIWGDILEHPVFAPTPIDRSARRREYQEALPDLRKSPAFGYTFDQASVSAEVAAVDVVIAQYATTINCGALDPEKALPEFIESLKGAGIDKIIAENQKQFDEWLALE